MSFVQKFMDLVGKNADKVGPAVDKIGDMVDGKTKGKYKDHVDTVQQKTKEAVDGLAKQQADKAAQAGNAQTGTEQTGTERPKPPTSS
ncbi:antitoxin [Actinocorallia longicatena]|uniref:Antitoxin protein of toxin-antitoxin system n=1 Tax=Actinocorallia longicatena TaxID=111803 RepID=A0ABP6QNE2_9ACTN